MDMCFPTYKLRVAVHITEAPKKKMVFEVVTV